MVLDVKELIIDYLKEAKLMSLATCNKDKPWAATVWFAFDDRLNLYFISQNFRRHVAEIKSNPSVAGTIAKPHKDLGAKVTGVQFEGNANEVSILELPKIFKLFVKRFPNAKANIKSVKNIIENTIKTRFYKIKPVRYVLFDEINFPKNPRQELVLKNR